MVEGYKWRVEKIREEMMGLIDLPYNACRVVTGYKSVALGDMQSLKNNFLW